VKTERAMAEKEREREREKLKERTRWRRGQKITDEGAYYRSVEFTSNAISFPFYCPSFFLAS